MNSLKLNLQWDSYDFATVQLSGICMILPLTPFNFSGICMILLLFHLQWNVYDFAIYCSTFSRICLISQEFNLKRNLCEFTCSTFSGTYLYEFTNIQSSVGYLHEFTKIQIQWGCVNIHTCCSSFWCALIHLQTEISAEHTNLFILQLNTSFFFLPNLKLGT